MKISKKLEKMDRAIDKAIADYMLDPDDEPHSLITLLIGTLAATCVALAKDKNNTVEMAQAISKDLMMTIIKMRVHLKKAPFAKELLNNIQEEE